ncbi:NUDIX hydrolase [Lichenihabitans psoromatis]|uniref:NUDIX hydrolase n=1 Tax=Lichenihabitans psoromatis TaxID=2528642 RepID=UPI0013F17367|nr:NUDIX hydrolase [Lichenihabitans psoromatis]
MSSKTRVYSQYGAVPFRIKRSGDIEIMLITSRDTGRWIVPKGWPISKLKPRQVAAQEAWEEAGLRGKIVGKAPLGHYLYSKAMEDEPPLTCKLTLFALQVSRQRKSWPEKGQRKTAWFDVATAAATVREPELAAIIAGVPRMIESQRPVSEGQKTDDPAEPIISDVDRPIVKEKPRQR